MARKVKCYCCKQQNYKENMLIHQYVSPRSLELKSRFYCNEHCRDKVELEKDRKEECFAIIDELLEIPCRTNIYFNKMYSPIIKHYGSIVMLNFLKNEYTDIHIALQKDFKTENVKIKYFIAILQNNIGKYKNVEQDNKLTEKTIENIDDNFFNTPKVDIEDKSKRSIEDLFGGIV